MVVCASMFDLVDGQERGEGREGDVVCVCVCVCVCVFVKERERGR